MSDVRTRLLGAFQHELDAIERQVPMRGGYARVEPHIRDFEIGGQAFSLIIYHMESQQWYDRGDVVDWSVIALQKHRCVGPGDIVFDLGCNAGFKTCWFAEAVGPEGRVYAFDPFPWNALATRYNALLNGLNNVTVHEEGVSHTAEDVRISVDGAQISNRTGDTFMAKIRPLSDYADLRPTVLKVDIEGAEYEVSQTDWRLFDRLRFIHLGLHPQFIEDRGLDPRVCMENFLGAGFDALVSLDDPTSRYMPATTLAHGYYMTRLAYSR